MPQDHLQDDNDDPDGELITLAGDDTNQDPNQPEDRGDIVTGDDEGPAPAATPPAAATPPTDPEPASTKPQPQHIPKARFDEVNSKKNELALELEEANRQLELLRKGGATPPASEPPPEPPPPTFDEKAKEREYASAMIDGDVDRAIEIRAEINQHLRAETRREFEADNNHRAAVTSLQEASAQAVQDFPYLNTPDGEEALDLIIASRDARIARGVSAPEALRQAVASIAPKFAPSDTETPGSSLPNDPGPIDTRERNAIARGAADSNSQPPNTQGGSGNRALAARVDPTDLTEEQFENLSLAEKKRLRGD